MESKVELSLVQKRGSSYISGWGTYALWNTSKRDLGKNSILVGLQIFGTI